MTRALPFTPHFVVIIVLLLSACGSNSSGEEELISEASTHPAEEHPYPSFSGFPQLQFKTISLGATQTELTLILENLPIDLIAEEEVTYFRFPADSTELIIPPEPQLTEFKVFLKGAEYLEDPAELRAFLREHANESTLDDRFPVYTYSTSKIDFKVTYFELETFIRLHFMLLKNHA